MRKIWIALLILLVAIAGGLYYAFTNLEYFVERAIEQAGSQATQTRVAVDAVVLQLEKGQGTVKGLKVENPPNYPAGEAIQFDMIDIVLNPGQSRFDLVVLDRVKVSEPVIQYMLGPGTSNLDVIRRNASRASASPSDSIGPLLKIQRMTITGGRLLVYPPDDEMFEISVPDITLNNVGGAKGATGAAVATEVVRTVTQQVLMVAARSEVQRRLGTLTEDLEETLPESVGEAIEGLLGR